MASSYCPACGSSTDTRNVSRGDGVVQECVTCGFVLDDAQLEPEEWSYEPPSTILFADDSDLMRSAIQEALLGRKLAEAILGARDGEEFLEVFTWQLREGNPVQLALLDVEMPKLDGFSTAVALRAVERGFDVEPTPLLFYSSRPCDARARAVVTACGPAQYVNKMSSPDLDQLAARIENIMFVMLRRRIAA
jgi:CheY-like chemotaxis protein